MHEPGAPSVSVIVPAYNTAAYIGRTIGSIVAQTCSDYEIIVINDGSPDTPAMERALAPYRDRIKYIRFPTNRGLTIARNTGILNARGHFIAFLDSDDEWEPTYLEEQLPILQADPTLDVVYPNVLIIGDHPHAGRTFMDVCPSEGEPTFRSVLYQQCNVFVSALVRRDAVLRVGMFDEHLGSVEDFDLWMRMLASGARMTYNRRVLARRRKRRDSLSANAIGMAERVVEVLDKLASLDLSPDDRAALIRRQAFFRARLDLARAKFAFFRLETGAAVEWLERANEYFKSRRLRIIAALMRTSPGMLLRLYRLRDRLLLGTDTSF
jgi:glycosyltransferase involved in cell wall biosynthesis